MKKLNENKLKFTKNSKQLYKPKLDRLKPKVIATNQSNMPTYLNFQIQLQRIEEKQEEKIKDEESVLINSFLFESVSSEWSYPSYSDSFPDSPTVRGYRSQRKKEKEESEFKSFLLEQEEKFEKQRERANSQFFLTPSAKQPPKNRRRMSTADPHILKNHFTSIDDSPESKESHQKGGEKEVWNISPSPRNKSPIKIREFKIRSTLTDLKRRFSSEEEA